MTLRFLVIIFLALASTAPNIAEKYEPFEDAESATNHGWSMYSPTTDFAASIVSTSRTASTSGPGEAEIIVNPAVFKQTAYFADTNLGGVFTIKDDFSFTGNMRLEGLDPGDSMIVVIGFFDSQAVRDPAPSGKPPFVGIKIGSGYGNPFYIQDGFIGAGSGWSQYIDGGTWLPDFDADGAIPISVEFNANRGLDDPGYGDGNVVATIGSQTTWGILENLQNEDPHYDAFGVLVWGSIFEEVTGLTIVLDDLRYSTPTPEPSSLNLVVVAGTFIWRCRFRSRNRASRKSSRL